MSTAQEIFDQVVTHLRTQGAQAVAFNDDGSVKRNDVGNPICLYRTVDGKKCAAGALITDDEYRPEMEGQYFGALLYSYPNVKERLGHHEMIISALQRTHDFSRIENWEDQFKDIAVKYGVTYTPPSESK